MTQYCNRCCLPFDGECCPVCGRKNAKQIGPNDLCFLTEKEQLWSGMLADVLNQQKIPFVQKNVFGAGMAMKIGLMNERIRFYVFYGHLAEAMLSTPYPFHRPFSTKCRKDFFRKELHTLLGLGKVVIHKGHCGEMRNSGIDVLLD